MTDQELMDALEALAAALSDVRESLKHQLDQVREGLRSVEHQAERLDAIARRVEEILLAELLGKIRFAKTTKEENG
jgi:hypothetical protein